MADVVNRRRKRVEADMEGLADVVVSVMSRVRDKHAAELLALAKQIEDLKTEVNYLTWSRQHETAKV